MTESDAKTIGRYVVQSLLGEGAMGSVYKAFDPVIKRIVAIKTIKMDQSRSEEDQQEFLQRFFQEAQISGILNHPNIVSIYDIGEQDGMPYIAMEYVEGRNLNQIMHDENRPDTAVLARIIMQISNALEFAHGKGIVHRDLKPGNIMVQPKGMAKIMDFGIAKMSGSHLTQTGVFLGTPSFASPEQIKEGHVDHRSDIFSLGILAHETLSGHTPFPGQSISAILYKIANEPPTPAPNLKDMSVEVGQWRAVFDKVFQKDPASRYQHAAQFGQDLLKSLKLSQTDRAKLGTFMGEIDATVRDAFGIQKDIQRSEFEMAQSPGPSTAVAKPKKKSSTVLGLVAALLIALIGVGGLWKFGIIGQDWDLSSVLPFAADWLPSPKLEQQIGIESEPEGAEIYVDDIKEGQVTPTQRLFSGNKGDSFKVRIEKEGFLPQEQTLVLSKEMTDNLSFTLAIKPVAREINSSPIGAEVFVDGENVGITPISFDFVDRNSYDIRISKSGYEDRSLTYVEGKDEVAALTVKLSEVQQPGVLMIDSEMDDLQVTVAGKSRRGNRTELPAGTHNLRLRSPKYFFSQSTRVRIQSGETSRISTPPIITIPKIDIVTADFAKVKIDGSYIKKGGEAEFTPITDLRIAAGEHRFEFEDADGNIIDEIRRKVDRSESIICCQ